MAARLGVERTYWSRFELGRRGLSDDMAVLLVARFGVTLDWLSLGRTEGLPLWLADRLRAAEANTSSTDRPV